MAAALVFRVRHLAVAAAALLAGGCGGVDETFVAVARDTLPNGAELIRYLSLPDPVDTLAADLRIGVTDGAPHEIFGDVRSVEADAAGNIYILDAQSGDVRVFDPAGSHLRTIARQGRGPGEVAAANGMRLHGDTLWIQDHGQWQMIGLSPEGTELVRYPMPVRAYGYVWDGAIDARGRLWNEVNHQVGEPTFPPKAGLNEGELRAFMKVHDRGSGRTDSVALGVVRYRSFVTSFGDRGYSVQAVPFAAKPITAIRPSGGFWRTSADAYRIARLDERGDTVLVIEADLTPRPVTAEDRDRYVERRVERAPPERAPAERAAGEEIVGLSPATHPVIDQLVVDDEDRLWVRRAMAQGEPVRYDVYGPTGDYLGSVRLGFEPAPYLPVRVRGGRMHAIVRDSLDVPAVVRADVRPIGSAVH